MKAPAEIVHLHEDPAAKRIGSLYREGQQSYINAGKMLRDKKKQSGHGAWLPWLAANEKALGFGERTARRLTLWAEHPELEPEDIWRSGEHQNGRAASDLPKPAPKAPKPKSKADSASAVVGDLLQDECEDCNSDTERWERSLSNLAGDAISMRAFWFREFGKWENFLVTPELVTLAEQAGKEWIELASELSKRR